MKNKLFSILTLLVFSQYSLSQEKIKADLKTINFLGKKPL